MNKEDIRHIANIAQIDFTDEELDKFAPSFDENIELVNKIKEIDTDGVEMVFQVNGTENNIREDKTGESLTQEEALENAATKKYGYFKLIKFVE
ncbi:MAG: Asp-tRNA(Asn)/Glu-tRNA(Gln) amidotransferase subunit GatC [Peptoniphilus harei]|uniref:Aspartyl/glutamyl-tRNA(Asn/Gln) amidotransferase subunit C n=1 Tax=Peptoniphilus harei ACS-146-V-Sch2b TaxID=908338 RepID=E4KYM9_9FIRM|nr:Asp-tRNA(Asn)/Glu-tRNA(Gln) amidotransferase subunit GatC [Peptoniphilus harei]EFR33083.1 aspartyl/glutamyl-tRNA(Asn/Gln) amidotransferase, C subunit [Peptoniphilus harei ACS-146-V-Sch2b]MDK7376640.1 Asp-tRNA(Asn)/Glu-tRNA(Gln) amidotransferase subunit GatC [Peptoniphilus harei]MDK7679258.1 Asp-tRNA(Asn)/Glu-tRNA(Gln) amidotransferase subunit GatC [Peptoniphilus harei]MDK7755129.1 Asp-tRNA(Asn)/Glu-tRNA(Gln) amidotransferase subunit GatC [Peptoniphilus harei]MDK7760936.1 Asp-tRNA(Asn)/Glu-t